MSKGKFSNPRPYREEEREIEKSFRQLTGQEKPVKPEDPIFSEASVPDLDTTDPEAADLITEADNLFPEENNLFSGEDSPVPDEELDAVVPRQLFDTGLVGHQETCFLLDNG